MKQNLFSALSLCLLGFSAQAQWVNQPISFSPDNAPIYLDAVDANTAWVATVPLFASSYIVPQVAHTVNGGQTWTLSTLPLLPNTDEDLTSLTAVSPTTAWVTTIGGNRILNTTDGGATWTVQGAGTVFAASNSFPDLIHFSSATDGLAIGDALTNGGSLEMYVTRNGGTTWTPVTGPAALPNEYPISTQPAAIGNHIWFATNRGRVFHSLDKGLTWTVAVVDPNLVEGTSLAFRDAQNGLLSVLDETSTNHRLYRTTDGGATWASVIYSGPLHGIGLSAVPGTAMFVSTGADLGNGDQGSSVSRDNGQTWTALESTLNHLTTEFLSATEGWSGSFAVNGAHSAGSVNRFSSTALSTRADASLQAGLSVAPNPAAGGRFTLQGTRAIGGMATVRVLDATGRQVSQQTWAGTSPLAFDLSAEPAGLYLLEVQGAAGTARKKVVVQ